MAEQYTPKDFKSNQEIRWCPGCGDHGIINSVQKAMAELGYPKESWAVISGIGCSSRFPYYMNTYGFHTIHGRAAAIASGAKSANPKLNILQVSGDGDAWLLVVTILFMLFAVILILPLWCSIMRFTG